MKNQNERHDSWKCHECCTPLLPKLCDSCSGRGRTGLVSRKDCGVCEGNGFTWRCPRTGSHRASLREAVHNRRAKENQFTEWDLWPRTYEAEPAGS